MTAIALCRAVAIASATLLLTAMLTACYPVRRAEPIVGPVTLNDPALEHGRELFQRHCYKCHTEGEGGLGPSLNDKPLPKFLMRLQTRLGGGAMPTFSNREISDAELDDLLSYVVALRQRSTTR